MFSEVDNEFDAYRNQSVAGDKAKAFMNTEGWQWFKETILGVLQDQALNTLKTATTDEDRVAAQQMYLASIRPEELLTSLVSQGDAAKVAILSLAEENNGKA